MPTILDRAIVMGRVDYSETSQIIVAFTHDHGKVRAIAKGVKRGTKKRFAVGIDLLEVGEMVVSSREETPAGLVTLTEWKQTRALPGLREKLHRLYAGQYVAEITNGLTEDWDAHPGLYDKMLDSLVRLSEAAEPFACVVDYQAALLDGVGSMPRFDDCVICGRAEPLSYFSSFEGGMLCRDCEPPRVEKRAVSPRSLQAIRKVITVSRGVVPGTAVDVAWGETGLLGVFDILDYHISHLMGKAPVMGAKLVSPESRRGAQQW